MKQYLKCRTAISDPETYGGSLEVSNTIIFWSVMKGFGISVFLKKISTSSAHVKFISDRFVLHSPCSSMSTLLSIHLLNAFVISVPHAKSITKVHTFWGIEHHPMKESSDKKTKTKRKRSLP